MEYGISYFGNRILKYVEKDMIDLKQTGFQTVVHTFSEADFDFSEKYMAKIVQATKRAGLTVWIDPWGVGGVFGGEAFSGFLQKHPEAWQISNHGKMMGSACLNMNSFRAFIRSWIDACVNCGADTIFWDEPHLFLFQPRERFPDEWTCRCSVCQSLFKDKYGYVMPNELISDIVQFRNDSILSFFTEMTSYAKSKSIENALCFLPFESDYIGITDYEGIAKLNSISNLGSDPYWMAFQKPMQPFLSEVTQRVLSLSDQYQKKNHIWMQAFSVPSGRESELVDGAQIIQELGAQSILFWGVGACAHISRIAPDDPEKVWNTVQHIVRTTQ